MSIKHKFTTSWFVSHEEFFSDIPVSNEDDSGDKTKSKVRLNPNLFQIHSPFKSLCDDLHLSSKQRNNLKRRKRRIEFYGDKFSTQVDGDGIVDDIVLSTTTTADVTANDYNPDCQTVITLWEDFLRINKSAACDNVTMALKADNNEVAFEIVDSFFKIVQYTSESNCMFSGNNESKAGLFFRNPFMSNNEDRYFIPNEARWICMDLKEKLGQCKTDLPLVLLGTSIDDKGETTEGTKFDLILMDPPWKNKYVRRRKRKQPEAGYAWLATEDLVKLPIEELTHNNSYVVIWCTNCTNLQNMVLYEFFPRWQVTFLTKWFWIKVTKTLEPVTPFRPGEDKKQPYEVIIIGKRCQTPTTEDSANSSAPASERNPEKENPRLIVSVPSAIHSHKPPLINVLKDHFCYQNSEFRFNKCCELFARYLTPGFTSVGNQVLYLQHESLYVVH